MTLPFLQSPPGPGASFTGRFPPGRNGAPPHFSAMMPKTMEKSARKWDRSAIVFIALGLFVIIKTQQMQIGSFTEPGPGLYPLLVGAVLFVLSCYSLFVSGADAKPAGTTRSRYVYLVLAILVAFRLLLPLVGYTCAVSLLFVLPLKFVAGQKWLTSLILAGVFTAGTYLVFVQWLAIVFPKAALFS